MGKDATPEGQKPLELDVYIGHSEIKNNGSVVFEEYRFNCSLIMKYCVCVKRGEDRTRFWFDKKDAAIHFWNALFSEVDEPLFVRGPEYREL